MASIGGRVVPGDVCSEILLWLPAKEALRGRSICRAFDVSSHDRTFFLWQSRRARDDSGLFLRRHDGRFEMVFTDACAGMPPESLQFLKGGNKRILGSHGGIVIFDTMPAGDPSSTSGFCLYNPVQGELRHIPRPDGASILSVRTFGVAILFADDDAGDHVHRYDVVCMTPTSEWSSNMVCWLYSSKEEAWMLIGDNIYVGPRNIKFHSPVVSSHGRVIYLASDCGRYQKQEPYIVAVDIDTGTSKILPLTEKVLATDGTSGDLEQIEIAAGECGALSVVHCNSASEFTVWEVKDPDMSWVWEQRGRVSMAAMGLQPRPVHGVSLVNGDVLVFTVNEDVYVHSLKDEVGQVKVIKGQEGCCPYMCAYANTFRPCEDR
ncbi:hypothetical protein Taro_048127 [Colocasia esculenta]|uniref:F-box domain-containing protein n=1 Tax=Colocasia esculenta TaxID=4460 RepID=A0A843X4U0_COLES|nr:hypothetical protein [Colocasia esculenta]